MRWLLVPVLAALCASLAADSAPGQTARLAQGLEVTFESDRNGTSDVWAQDEGGPNCTQICDPNVEEAQPSQVPGRATTYTSQRDGDFDIYALTQNGTVQVTDHPRARLRTGHVRRRQSRGLRQRARRQQERLRRLGRAGCFLGAADHESPRRHGSHLGSDR